MLSEDPTSYRDAPTEGVRRVLELILDTRVFQDQPIYGSVIEWIRVGTTVAINVLLERKGEKFALLITSGFKDMCEIGRQTRPKLFDLNMRKPGVLYEKVVEIKERVTIDNFTLNPFPAEPDLGHPDLVKTESGEVVRTMEKLDKEGTRRKLEGLFEEGYRSAAIALLLSYVFPG